MAETSHKSSKLNSYMVHIYFIAIAHLSKAMKSQLQLVLGIASTMNRLLAISILLVAYWPIDAVGRVAILTSVQKDRSK